MIYTIELHSVDLNDFTIEPFVNNIRNFMSNSYDFVVNGIKFDKAINRYYIPYTVEFDMGVLMGIIGLAKFGINNQDRTVEEFNTLLEDNNVTNSVLVNNEALFRALPIIQSRIVIPSYIPDDTIEGLRMCYDNYLETYNIEHYDNLYPSKVYATSSVYIKKNTGIMIKDRKLFDLISKTDIVHSSNQTCFKRSVTIVVKTHDILVYTDIIKHLVTKNIEHKKVISGTKQELFDTDRLDNISLYNRIQFHKTKTRGSYIELIFSYSDRKEINDDEMIQDYFEDYMKTYGHRTKVRKVGNEFRVNISKDVQSIIDFMSLTGIKPSGSILKISLYELHNVTDRGEIFNEFYIK